MLGLKGDIPTESLHPRSSQQSARPKKQPSQEVKLQAGDEEPCQESVYVCEVR